jgi:hypothetical protein
MDLTESTSMELRSEPAMDSEHARPLVEREHVSEIFWTSGTDENIHGDLGPS